ncbi:TldD/PmbA family protein [uncultured Ilyobacter sp.]|uniref:TldD/PmbA family protein n=1 Tax=uncultured Ilyobacter sp. TaxID=544433 RepID=UPI0029C73F4B|nr:TldD/PmbA family protein [uncultured Ilyobacter sp.]
MMEINIFIDLLFKNAKERGLENFEIYYTSSKSSSIKVFNQEVDSYSDSTSQGISFRVLENGKMGYSYTESIAEKDINFLISEALENAAVIENEDIEEIFCGGEEYTDVEVYNPDLEDISIGDKVSLLMETEKKAKEMDIRVKRISHCVFGNGSSTRIIKNSKGLNLSEKGNSAYIYISLVAEEEGITKSGSSFKVSDNFSSFNADTISKESVEEAVSKLNPVSIGSKEYKAIIKNEAFASMLGAFTGIFSSDNVQKGISKLKGKLGSYIASENVTIIDNPHMKRGMASSSFDAEGVPTKYKEVIKNGVLTTYLYNLKTAKKDGVKSTGNASKGGYKGTLGISPSNFYLKEGDTTYINLIEKLSDGVLVTSLAGLHSGLNSISGDFSLAAEGFFISDGKITNSLNQITVSGNFFDLLNEIVAVGNDLKFGLSPIGSPSILVKKLSISAD